jgi:hypothetical protein
MILKPQGRQPVTIGQPRRFRSFEKLPALAVATVP